MLGEFAQNNIYAIEFDGKAIKIAKAMNLIAGDGKSNVYRANSLDPKHWDPVVKSAFKHLLQNPDDEEYQDFAFDVLLTNPPFAGNISERDILRQYQLAERNGRTVSKIGRDILFIERCLRFLRPGGRMAIVLPQGRLNNTKDLYIRNFILSKTRILAVIGLHPNTFKPHTSTKTSVLFLQKLTEEEIAKINEVYNHYSREWEQHLIELFELSQKEILTEDDLPEVLVSFLQAEFDDSNSQAAQDEEDIEDVTEESDSDEDLIEYIENLQSQLDNMPKRAKGRAEIQRALKEAQYKLASRTWKGRVEWLCNDDKMRERYREVWLAEKAIKELDYPIFFAVSEKGGKDNRGEPIYKKNEAGEFSLDEHGHLIVDHDLDEIAEAFIAFAKEQGLDFWVEE